MESEHSEMPHVINDSAALAALKQCRQFAATPAVEKLTALWFKDIALATSFGSLIFNRRS